MAYRVTPPPAPAPMPLVRRSILIPLAPLVPLMCSFRRGIPIPLVPLPPMCSFPRGIPLSLVPLVPRVHRVLFYDDDIEVIVAKRGIHVDQWISHIRWFYGDNVTNMSAVGLDTEWRPNFSSGEDHPIATIQLCVGRHCLIFQPILADFIPHSLHDFLADPQFTFCGVGIQDDVKKLYRHHGLRVGRTTDINDLLKLKKVDCNHHGRMVGLKKMVYVVLGKEMVKPIKVTLSAWDSKNLDDEQIEYAAIDAFVSSQLALALAVSSES